MGALALLGVAAVWLSVAAPTWPSPIAAAATTVSDGPRDIAASRLRVRAVTTHALLYRAPAGIRAEPASSPGTPDSPGSTRTNVGVETAGVNIVSAPGNEAQ